MKMEHIIAANSDGTVGEVLVAKDEQVERGAALLTMLSDASTEVPA
jgi:biotin carboxyl carrier protein